MFDPKWQLYVYQRREQMAAASRRHLLKQDQPPLRWRTVARSLTRLGEVLVKYGTRLKERSQAESETLCTTTPLRQVSGGFTMK